MRSSSTYRKSAKPLHCSLCAIATILALACWSTPAAALDPTRSLSQFVHQYWGPEQGFLGGTIHAICRSSDGYLWIGTDRGLVRFDGYTFDLIQQPIPDMPPIGTVRSMALDARGVLWVLLDGAHLLLYRDGHFSDAFATLGIQDMTFSAMALDREGNIVLSGIGNSVMRWENGKLNVIARSQDVQATVTAIAESRNGRIWLGTQSAGLLALEQGRAPRAAAIPGFTKINALLPANNGGLWVGTDRGIRFLTTDEHLLDNLPAWTHRLQITTLYRDEGCVWASTSEGVLRITPDDEATIRGGAGDNKAVDAVFADGEGDLWFGGPGGLERLQDGVFTTYSAAAGFPAAPVGAIFADAEGAVWFAPLTGGLYWYKDGRLRQVRQDGLDHDVIYSIDGGNNEIWVGRQQGGLTRILRSGDALVTRTYTIREGLAQNNVYAVHRSANGDVWAGTVSGGISVLGPSGFKTYSTNNGLASNAANSITESRDGAVWIATPVGLEEFHGGHWTLWGTENGLPPADVRLCFADAEGVVWIATGAGLSYLSGGHITTLRNLPNQMREQMLGIVEDHLGYLWVSTSDHVLRVNRRALLADSLRVSDIESYGTQDGLSGIEALRRERSLVTGPAGKVWISLSRGIAAGEPTLTARDSLPIGVRINSIFANGRDVNLSESSDIPAGTKTMTFRYESDSLFAPDRVRFRYRLEGADPDWSEAVEWRQVSYHNLSPGRYRFHVIASREGRLWNSPETVDSFTIDPSYWQTWWFRAGAAAFTTLLILLFSRLRGIRLSRQLHVRFQERLSERTRIAQELHDTLLQSFQGLMLRFQTVNNLLPMRPAEAKQALEEALERADCALIESRSAIQNIRSVSSASNLAQAINNIMAEMAQEYAQEGDHPPGYSTVTEGAPKPLNPSANVEVLRIAQESLRNAFQHASASRIEAEVTFGESHLCIRFRDDGVGIDPDILKFGHRLGHWGLIGMKERASQLGATLDVWSKPGAGTELDLNVPGNIAYAGFKNKNGFRALRKRFDKRHEH